MGLQFQARGCTFVAIVTIVMAKDVCFVDVSQPEAQERKRGDIPS